MLRYNTPKNLVDNIDRLKDIGVYQRPMTRKPYWETEILEKNKHPIYITSEDINFEEEKEEEEELRIVLIFLEK